MISRYDVWLNDEPLSGIDPNLYVADIAYTPAGLTWQTNRLAKSDGVYSGERGYLDTARISVAFAVREYSTQRRHEIVQAVARWAADGGWLKTSDRIGQRIYVKLSRFPAVTSAMRWTETLTVEFTAYDYPYWQDEHPLTLMLSSGETKNWRVPGMRPACVSAAITAGASLSGVNIQVGDTRLVLDALSVDSGGSVTVSYTDDHHILKIEDENGVSMLNKRTAASDDDLLAMPGLNVVSFTATGTGICILSVRGVYV